MANSSKKIKTAKDILLSHDFLSDRKKSMKYVTKEFQDYGYRLAVKLNDMEHKALYIKLAKNENRNLLDRASSFAEDYPKAKNKGKVFMWKLSELRRESKKAKEEKKKEQVGFKL